jgi:hypothetical protein
MTKDEALKLALDALENHTAIKHPQQIHYRDKAITAIKEALAQPEQEPVAWMTPDREGFRIRFSPPVNDVPLGWDALYLAPPQRTEQEPVATVTSETGADISMSWWHEPALPVGTKLYITPPQRTEQEPVAWGVFEGNLHDMFFTEAEAVEMAQLKGTHAEVKPLYTTPPQRTWVGLTKTAVGNHLRRHALGDQPTFRQGFREGVAFAEAKLRSKNT